MLGLLALAGVLAAAPPGASDPRAPVLVWHAPTGCPGEPELRAQVDALLAGAPAGVGRNVTIELRVEPLPGGRWRLDAAMRGPGIEGRRSLEADRCHELAEAAALLSAIAVYPALASGPADAPPAAVVPAAPPAPRDPAPVMAPPPEAPAIVSADSSDMPLKPPSTPAPAAWPPQRWPLAVAVGPGFGVLPGVSAVLSASAGFGGRGWSVALRQTFWLPRDLPAPGDPTVGGRVWLWATGLRACGIPTLGRVELPLCAGVEAGVLTGSGTGDLQPARTVTSAWAAASAGPGLAVRVAPRLALTLGVDVLVVLAYPRLQIPGRGTVCCDARVGAIASAGLELRFGRDPQRF